MNMKSAARGRFDADQLEDIRSRTPLSDLFAKFGYRTRGNSKARWMQCCFHGDKTPSLKVNDDLGMYFCFGCGASGDVFDAVMYLASRSFPEAVEYLGGVRDITPEERAQFEVRRREQEERERRKAERTRRACETMFDGAQPILGTHADAYLRARGLRVTPGWTFDLRFAPRLPYHGFVDDEVQEPSELGLFPAMVAAIRDKGGKLIGVHRTYLDAVEPRKLKPPGDQTRNKAKKVLGEQTGGLIRLSEIRPHMGIGEGIETTRSWYVLGRGGTDDVGIASAVSLGNLSGKSDGTVAHPKDPKKRIPNGTPDPDGPGVELPDEVEEATLIGDGDSDPYMTRARLLVAGQRFEGQGVSVGVDMADTGKDFNNMLLEDGEAM